MDDPSFLDLDDIDDDLSLGLSAQAEPQQNHAKTIQQDDIHLHSPEGSFKALSAMFEPHKETSNGLNNIDDAKLRGHTPKVKPTQEIC